MKKYFISFNYMTTRGFEGFANCFKNSLNPTPSLEEIKKWEEEILFKEIKKDNKVKFINIIFFKEVK